MIAEEFEEFHERVSAYLEHAYGSTLFGQAFDVTKQEGRDKAIGWLWSTLQKIDLYDRHT